MNVIRQVRWALLTAIVVGLVLVVVLVLPGAERTADLSPGGNDAPDQPTGVAQSVRSVPMPPVQQFSESRQAPQVDQDTQMRPALAAATRLHHRAAEKPDDKRPMIAIVIDDMAYSQRLFAAANDLPSAISFAFLPYVDRVAPMAAAARSRGHELLVHLPMEPFGPVANPGPGALMVAGDAAEWESRLQQALTAFDGYIGVNNHMGSRATSDQKLMRWLMTALKSRGLAFLDSKTTAKSLGEQAARSAGVPVAARQVFLDPDGQGAVAAQQFATALRFANKRGSVIIICHPYEKTLAFLSTKISATDPRYQLVPISRLLK